MGGLTSSVISQPPRNHAKYEDLLEEVISILLCLFDTMRVVDSIQ